VEKVKNFYCGVDRWHERREPLALATIVETRGSTPQIAGASALFSRKGLISGTLGGGVVEADAQEKAFRCLREGRSLFYQFGLRGDDLGAEEAICGGSVSILIDASPLSHLETFRLLKKSLLSRQAGVLISKISPTSSQGFSVSRRWLGDKPAAGALAEKDFSSIEKEIKETLQEGEPRLIKTKEKGRQEILFFLEPLFPLPQLAIAGAGHIGQAVAHLGSLLDFAVTVIDDRAEFASRERFPEADAIIVGDIGRAVADFPIASDTYIVIVTRGHSHDAETLRACIRSPAAYIGMIGSRRKLSLTRSKFIAEGWATEAQFDRVHGPIGLAIKSTTVAEIAVSIAAELVLVRSQAGNQKTASQK
jgi:xanthine dehydrogenase accessory factor